MMSPLDPICSSCGEDEEEAMSELTSQKMAIGVQNKLAEYVGVPFDRSELSLFAWHVLNDLTTLRKWIEELKEAQRQAFDYMSAYEQKIRDLRTALEEIKLLNLEWRS